MPGRTTHFEPGSTLGHFEIADVIGIGGMGIVYRARDTLLGRPVALKVLSSRLFESDEARARFLREAQLASRLSHPNVAVVHEVGESLGIPFIAMELVPGRNLKEILESGPVPLEELLAWGAQVCDAIDAAHRLGIVHRDIKSSNIMITPEGNVKVLDFGLAKALFGVRAGGGEETPFRPAPEGEPDAALEENLTAAGIALGTPSYMSPEQATGVEVDGRSDIFSLGVVLYEAAAGRLPFQGSTEREILQAIRTEDRSTLRDRTRARLPSGLWRVLFRCLARDVSERYSSAKLLKDDLVRLRRRRGSLRRKALQASLALLAAALTVSLGYGIWIGFAPPVAAPMSIRTIGVLPFENVSGNSDENYLAAAVPLELTSRLGQIAAIKVIPWTFMKRYQDVRTSLVEIGGETGADAILEGAVELAPQGATDLPTLVRIHLQLFNTRSGVLIWTSTFERDLGSFLKVRGEIARQIAGEIRVQLARRETAQVVSSRQVDGTAMQNYLRGRAAQEERTRESLSEAADRFRAAVERDPGFAESYVALAETYVLLTAYWGELDPKRAHRLTAEATSRALEIDSSIGEAWASRAFGDYVLAWDWLSAEEGFRRALELAPNAAEVHHWYADYLSAVGRHPLALVHSRIAEERSPLSPVHTRRVAWTLFYARRYDEAIAQLQKTLERDPDFEPAQTLLGRAFVQSGRYGEGIEELRRAGPAYSAMLAQAYAAAGRAAEARSLLASLMEGTTPDPVFPYAVALIHAALGDADVAVEWLERAYRERDPAMVSLKTDPFLDPLRGNSRFEDLLRQMNFPP